MVGAGEGEEGRGEKRRWRRGEGKIVEKAGIGENEGGEEGEGTERTEEREGSENGKEQKEEREGRQGEG